MPNHEELNRFILLPNTEHSIITGLLALLPSVNAWLANIIAADQYLTKSSGQEIKLQTIDDRNSHTQRMASVANIPKFNWTIDPENGDITVMSEVFIHKNLNLLKFLLWMRLHQLR